MTDIEIRALRAIAEAEYEYPFEGKRVVRLCDELLEARRLLYKYALWHHRDYHSNNRAEFDGCPTPTCVAARAFVKEPTP